MLRVTSIVSSTATASKDLILHFNTAMGGQPADATGTELQANSTIALNDSKFTNLYIYQTSSLDGYILVPAPSIEIT